MRLGSTASSGVSKDGLNGKFLSSSSKSEIRLAQACSRHAESLNVSRSPLTHSRCCSLESSGTGLSSKTFSSRALAFSSKSDSLGLAQISFSVLVLDFAQSKLAEWAHGIHIKDITSNDQTVVVFISVHGLSRTHFSSNPNVLGLILMFFR